jgi:hypothetical protein
LGDGGKVTLLLRFPCVTSQRTKTEQELIERYLAGLKDQEKFRAEGRGARAE